MTRHRAHVHKKRRSDDGQTGGWSIDLLWLNPYHDWTGSPSAGWECSGEAWEPTWPRAIATAEAYIRTGAPYPTPRDIELWERRLSPAG